jgi:D-alanyl-D-alanine carboxypeptidase/D-alanyl-D-alanine-endopeptidase (penicillin-binding protein 4)
MTLLVGLLLLLSRLPAVVGQGAAGARQPRGGARPAAPRPLPAPIQAVMNRPKYRSSRWGLFVADRATGAVIYDLNGGDPIIPASTTKLFPAAAALDVYGPDYRFETPVYRRGSIQSQGELRGDLILVASGDLTMGGRDLPDGQIAFTSIDHSYANAVPGATLTPTDPLAGLDDLARQVWAAGIRRVRGDVIIDARLFPQMAKDDYILSPMMINDNLVDLTIRAGSVGGAATVVARPQTAAYAVRSEVTTVATGQPAAITITAPRPGQILVSRRVPAGSEPLLRTYQVEDPPSFARTLFIEALRRQGVTVTASPTGRNPATRLPPAGSYRTNERVALHRSLPFAQNIKLILKVSMNQQADTLIYLLALKQGKQTFDEGVQAILPFLKKAGIDERVVYLSDGRGDDVTDLFSPRAATQLLRYMATRPDFRVYYDAQPVLGVDGTEKNTLPSNSPARGKIAAKSGTMALGDALHGRLILMTRGNAGYMVTRSGRQLVFAVYVMYVPMNEVEDLFAIAKEVGSIAEIVFERN